MARIRSIKPEFWLDRKLARQLSRDERMLYLGLWNQADEHARAQADPRLIKGQVFPFDDDLTDDDIEAMLKALQGAGVVQVYEHDGDPYLFLPKLHRHQRLEPAKVASKFPEPPEPGSEQPTPVRPDESARGADQSEPDDKSSALLYVAGSMEHGAGPRGADESAPRRADRDIGFAEFWDRYPRKKAKPAAEKAWRAAIKRARPDVILDGLSRYPFRRDDPQFVPYPATWLNQDRWADAPDNVQPIGAAGSNGTPSGLTREQVDDVLGPDIETIVPPPDLDPAEDHPAYQAWMRQARADRLADRERQALAQLSRRERVPT